MKEVKEQRQQLETAEESAKKLTDEQMEEVTGGSQLSVKRTVEIQKINVMQGLQGKVSGVMITNRN